MGGVVGDKGKVMHLRRSGQKSVHNVHRSPDGLTSGYDLSPGVRNFGTDGYNAPLKSFRQFERQPSIQAIPSGPGGNPVHPVAQLSQRYYAQE